jgi:hypothetical protein
LEHKTLYRERPDSGEDEKNGPFFTAIFVFTLVPAEGIAALALRCPIG